ncbi:unnamed protein product, partial [Lampetra planeri]
TSCGALGHGTGQGPKVGKGRAADQTLLGRVLPTSLPEQEARERVKSAISGLTRMDGVSGVRAPMESGRLWKFQERVRVSQP